MVKFGWDKLKRFLAQANTWTGKQTFSNIAVTGGTISGATITETFTVSTNPALNAAVTTAIVDAYNGVVVTLSAAGNTQTLQNPTTMATIRKFMVINNDTSNNNLSVVANSVTFTLTPGEGQCFLWDGSAWGPTDLGITEIPVKVTQGGIGASTLTDHGILLGSGTDPVTALTPLAAGELLIGVGSADPHALVAGATTKILVGGGAADPVWTEATGTGAPVRQTSPALVTPALGTPQSGDLRNCSAPTEADKGVTVYAGTTKALAGTDTQSAMTPADVKNKVAVDVNPKAMSQGVAMTYAASGSSGIQVADNDNIDFGTGNFTMCWKGSLPDWTPSVAGYLAYKIQDNDYRNGFLYIGTGGTFITFLRAAGTTFISVNSPANTFVNGTTHEITVVMTRETAAVAGSVQFYTDGVAFGSAIAITAAAPTSCSNSGALYISGDTAARTAGTTHHAHAFNRALTAAEVLDLYRNGVAPKHRKASQTALTSGTLVAGQEYTIDTFAAGDDFANVGGTNETGNVFVATGTAPTTWVNSSSLRATGGTLILEPEGIQPVQWLDAGANRLHAMQPAAGSRLTCTKRDFTIKWTNTWAASHEVQYIGGLNQAILPPNCYIDSIIGVITGGTIEDIIIGDGSDTDRWVTITTGLAAGTVAFTIANAISDGTNYKMTVDPDANFTGSISWTITGKIL